MKERDRLYKVRRTVDWALEGTHTQTLREYLASEEDLQGWLEVLLEKQFEVHMSIEENKAAMQSFHNECQRMGPAGKSRYFARKETHQTWLANAQRKKSNIVRLLREVRRTMRERGEEDDFAPLLYETMMGAILAAREFLIEDEYISEGALQYRDNLVREMDKAIEKEGR